MAQRYETREKERKGGERERERNRRKIRRNALLDALSSQGVPVTAQTQHFVRDLIEKIHGSEV